MLRLPPTVPAATLPDPIHRRGMAAFFRSLDTPLAPSSAPVVAISGPVPQTCSSHLTTFDRRAAFVSDWIRVGESSEAGLMTANALVISRAATSLCFGGNDPRTVAAPRPFDGVFSFQLLMPDVPATLCSFGQALTITAGRCGSMSGGQILGMRLNKHVCVGRVRRGSSCLGSLRAARHGLIVL